MGSNAPTRVCAVCVTYNPSRAGVERVVDATIKQVSGFVVVDNGSNPEQRAWLVSLSESRGFRLILLQENRGVAAALNRGVDAAVEGRFDAVLLLDHDSVPDVDMVERLVEATVDLQQSGNRVGAVGPQCVDASTGRSAPFVRLGWFGLRRQLCDEGGTSCRADLLITSGSLIRSAVLEKVGPMDESLFVDHVDTEWCLRARAAGFRQYGVCRARLLHSLGERGQVIWWFGHRVVHLHSAPRLYYYVRNAILLMRRSFSPWPWILAESVRVTALIVFYLTWPSSRRDYARMIGRGILDGLSGVAGALDCGARRG